jgi:threonine/homoserine/homoserine lactone efflux protein
MFNWISFLTFIVVMSFTPGPNNIMSMNNAANMGLKRSIPFTLGVLTGVFVSTVLCMAFSALLIKLIPQIQFPMKIAGAVYLLYLSYRTMVPAKKHGEERKGTGFFMGIALQIINPKIYIYVITGVLSFIIPYYTSPHVLGAFALLMAITAFVSTVAWAAFGSLFSKLFTSHKLVMNIIIVVLLLYCTISLFFE